MAGHVRSAAAPVAAGQSLTADGRPDFGYFGPGSVVWQVLSHPATAAMTVQLTGLFEQAHRGMRLIIAEHEPALRVARRHRGGPSLALDRVRRTIAVPVPVIAGDTATADRIAAHLRTYHEPLKSTMPGTGEPYDAGSVKMVVFAHVTIFHAALRAYEGFAFHGRHWPRRLPRAERDRYWRELVPFAELMGAPRQAVPDSAAAVERYYEGIRDEWVGLLEFPYGQPMRDLAAVVAMLLRLRSQRDVRDVALFMLFTLSGVAAISATPRRARRLWHIPRVADPALSVMRIGAAGALAPLAVPVVGDRFTKAYLGNDAMRLMRNARELTRSAQAA